MTIHTLKSEFELSGIGLHSGEQTRVRVLPAAVGEGRYFVRIDLPGAPIIPAKIDAVCQTALSTELAGIDAQIRALPAAETRFSYGIDFDEPAIGNQWYSWSPEVESFVSAIAPARTFGLARQVDQLRQAGLIKGGSLDNALVCDRSGWLNPPLRFTNEPVRHKILDLVGDLSLLGTWPKAHYVAYKASHNLHVQLGLALNSQALATLETS